MCVVKDLCGPLRGYWAAGEAKLFEGTFKKRKIGGITHHLVDKGFFYLAEGKRANFLVKRYREPEAGDSETWRLRRPIEAFVFETKKVGDRSPSMNLSAKENLPERMSQRLSCLPTCARLSLSWIKPL